MAEMAKMAKEAKEEKGEKERKEKTIKERLTVEQTDWTQQEEEQRQYLGREKTRARTTPKKKMHR